jgi:hypothetical protein
MMRARANFGTKPGSTLDPALKNWLDNVVIPALLREYLEQVRAASRKALAIDSNPSVLSLSDIGKREGTK